VDALTHYGRGSLFRTGPTFKFGAANGGASVARTLHNEEG
jgi:hypothetical protein